MINKTNCLICILIAFILYILGCAANRTGTITISSPRVWQDHAVVATEGEQYQRLNKIGDTINASIEKFQGRRARRYADIRNLRGSFQMQYPASSNVMAVPSYGTDTTDDYLSDKKQTKGIVLTDVGTVTAELSEDPIDLLQRVDDFNQILSGMKLTHLRDTLSMQKGWSVYLLGFDISLLPGDVTQDGHGARVEFTIENGKDYARVYSIWPQRYADRFQEATSIREDFRASLQLAGQSTQWAAQMAMNLAQRYEDDLANIQRYPLISGFVNNNGDSQTFGWEFNPRIRTVTKDRIWPLTNKPIIEYWLEPGVRQCYALVAIKDNRIEANNRVLELSKDDLVKIAFGGTVRLLTFKELIKNYSKILPEETKIHFMIPYYNSTLTEPKGEISLNIDLGQEKKLAEKILYAFNNCDKLGSEGDKERWDNFKESLRMWQNKHKELVNLIDKDSNDPLRKIVDDDLKKLATRITVDVQNEKITLDSIKGKYNATIEKLEAKKKGTVPQSLKNYFAENDFLERIYQVDSKTLEKWELTDSLIDLHYCMLGFLGHQGKIGENEKKKLVLEVKRSWFNRKRGQVVQLEKDIFDFNTNSEKLDPRNDKMKLTVETLPDKLDRTLVKISAVLPNEGIADGKNKTTVSIWGENFSNDAKVFIGGIEVPTPDVTVLGRDYIVAKLPVVDNGILDGAPKKQFDIKVITGGDLLMAENAFTYVASPPPPKEAPFAIVEINPKTAPSGKFINIKANNAVLDKVDNVFFGMGTVTEKILSNDKKTLRVKVPYDPNTKSPQPGDETLISLEFDPKAAITSNNKYQYLEPFTYAAKP